MENSEDHANLVARVAKLEQKLEETLVLLSDIYRFGNLGVALAAGKWLEADQETTRVMLEVAGKTSKEVLTPEDLRSFPPDALKVIDNLWRKYSNDRFGFSLQLQIYLELGGNLDTLRAQDMNLLRKLGDRLGKRVNGKWIEEDEIDFNSQLPIGFLPGNWWNSPYGAKMANFFLTRLLTCEL